MVGGKIADLYQGATTVVVTGTADADLNQLDQNQKVVLM